MNPGAWWRYSAAAMPLLAVSALAQPAWSACAPNQPGCQQEHQAPPPQHQQAPPPQHFEAPRPQPQQFQPQQHFEAPRPQPQQFQPQQHFEAPHPPPAAPHPQPQQFQQQPAPHPQQFQPQQHFEAHPQPAPHPQPQQFQQHAPPPGGFHPAPGGQAAQFQHDQFQHGVPPQRDLHAGHYSYRGHDYDRFRAEPYRWSRGEHYERYRIGARLPLAFIISSFIIADWAAYGLAPPPYGYEWVRYGPDVLLVDPGTGLIQDGAYSMFADTSDAGPPVYAAQPAYAPPPVTGQPQPLGRFGAWSAAMYQEGGQTVCYTFSPAFGSSQSLPGRPAPVLSVTQRPGLRDTVSISEGLNLPSGAPVSAQLDGASLDFFADGPTAYARNGAVAVAAFQRGNRADVTVPAPGGGPLTDSFNLSGFSAAYATISQACPQ